MTTKQRTNLALLVPVTCALLALVGCTRGHYRLRADADAYGRIIEKSACKPWQIPGDYSVYPAPHSRLHDPTCVNDPCLPSPAPQLYEYDLPALPERDPARFQPHQQQQPTLDVGPSAEMSPEPAPLPNRASPVPTTVEEATSESTNVDPSLDPSALTAPAIDDVAEEELTSPYRSVSYRASHEDRPVVLLAQEVPTPAPQGPANALPAAVPGEPTNDPRDAATNGGPKQTAADVDSSADENADDGTETDVLAADTVITQQVPLPRSYWELIPDECLAKMLEFETVRAEYQRSYGVPPEESQLDDSPKLALEDIMDLTLLNSRELQTQKEQLYRSALVLTLERFDYQLKPSVGNNGTDVNYTHNRSGGITVDNLRIPTTFQLEKMMYSGADFIGRFANSVLLTFNGPQGFAVDVGSDLLFDFSQSLLQRDVRLENLTQAERNVVYAARDFTRFRKQLFVQQASTYYSLIRQFRQIEIECQNYFTLAREFNQRSVEIKYGFAAKTQLDQVEQQVINGRQSILNACTNLENALDSLKISMGIPTEQPLNIDLTELNLVALRDELAVNAELIERSRARIQGEVDSNERSPFLIVGGVSILAEQMLDSLRIRQALGEESVNSEALESRILFLGVEAADIDVAGAREKLESQLAATEVDLNKEIFRRRDIAKELTEKMLWQLRVVQKVAPDHAQLAEWKSRYVQFNIELEVSLAKTGISETVDMATAEQQLVVETAGLQEQMEEFCALLDEVLGRTSPTTAEQFEQRSIEYADEAMVASEAFRGTAGGGLVPLTITMDDAMMTALVQRFDLMNQRGFLADDWRQIKYAADDLRSVLNINASHNIRTRSGQNNPFDFTFDDSTTSAGLSFDLPFNRRAQRNRFRTSLFDYQQTLRNVMQLEDNIKLSVRRDLRTLKLDRQQYANDIAGAALASERVKGTEAEVRLGVATSRDFLEAQQAYVRAISGVASDHINYIVGRLDLFLDLESLTVGDNGFWDQLYDENHQPQPRYQLPAYARPGYGELHPCLKYSKCIQRMRCVPDGVSMIHKRSGLDDDSYLDAEAEERE